MKNIFKFMGIALMAGAMMVACNPDTPEPEDTTPDTPTPQPTVSAKVTFGSVSWDASVAEVFTGNYANFGVNEYIMFKTADSYPYCDLMISAQPGTYQHEATLGTAEQGYTYYQWQTGQSASEMYLPLYSIKYFEAQAFQGQNTITSDWLPVSANLTVTSYDATNMIATFTLTATMYDYASWYQDLVTNAEDADTRDLEVKVVSYKFTEITE